MLEHAEKAGEPHALAEINPHLALGLSESFVSDSERSWLRWVKKVEKLIGHDLDGNQDSDGYSLDFAYACWEAGDPPVVYAADVIINEIASETFGPRVGAAS